MTISWLRQKIFNYRKYQAQFILMHATLLLRFFFNTFKLSKFGTDNVFSTFSWSWWAGNIVILDARHGTKLIINLQNVLIIFQLVLFVYENSRLQILFIDIIVIIASYLIILARKTSNSLMQWRSHVFKQDVQYLIGLCTEYRLLKAAKSQWH